MAKSKYNNRITEMDGITFHSAIEMKYYEHLKWLKENGEIQDFKLQPEYLLQEAFRKDGEHRHAIKYKADFEVEQLDGKVEVVDIKGFTTTDFMLKKKLFEYKYPYTLKLLTYSKIDGGWIDIKQLAKNRKERKKKKGNSSLLKPSL